MLKYKCIFIYQDFSFWGVYMKLLEERILKDGVVYPGNILKVGSFLNHQIDVELLEEMGKEVKRLFEGKKITKILTVEASGIAIATAFGSVLNSKVLFAKKHASKNLAGDVYSASSHSYTHGNDYEMVVEKAFLLPEDKVLIVDDFLAVGGALNALINIVSQSGAELVGCAIAIEKAYQGGGDEIRKKGIRVESLAMIESMEDGKIIFRK